MDDIDRMLAGHFGGQKPPARSAPLTDEEVRLFVENRLDGERLESVLARLASSADDRALVSAARKRLAGASEAGNERVHESLLRAASGSVPARAGASSCPHCGGAITPFKKSPARQKLTIGLWAAVSLAGLGASFVFPRYFVQCLVVCVLAGVKAIVDQRALKTQILVYRALEEPFDAPKRGHLHRDDARL